MTPDLNPKPELRRNPMGVVDPRARAPFEEGHILPRNPKEIGQLRLAPPPAFPITPNKVAELSHDPLTTTKKKPRNAKKTLDAGWRSSVW